MKSNRPLLILLLLLSAACSSGAPRRAEPMSGAAPVVEVGMSDAGSTGVVAATGSRDATGGEPAAAGSAADPVPQDPIQAMFRDPRFQQRFAESYLAETDIEPRTTTAERDLLQRVMERIAAGELERAAAMLEPKITPAASAALDFTLATIHLQRDRLDEAAIAYQTAIDKYGKFRRAHRSLGVLLVRQNRFDLAVQSLSRVIELGGADAITYGLLGYGYSNIDNHVAAESAYRMAVLLDPQTLDWQMGLARSFFKQRRFADAASLCGTLIERNTDRPDLWLLQANAWIGMGESKKAAENFEIVDRLGHATADSLNLLGDIYVNNEMYELAAGAYVRALDKNPQAGPDRALRAAKVLAARSALAECRHLLGRIETLFQGRMQDGQRRDMLKVRARIAVAEGDDAEEVKVLQETVALDPLDGEALLLLGQASNRAGDADRAVFYYEQAASIPQFEADAKVRHAQLLVGQGRYAEALPMLRKAQQIKPRDNIQQYLEQVERAAQSR